MITIGGGERPDTLGAYIFRDKWLELGNLKGQHLFNSVIQMNGAIFSTTYQGGIERIELTGDSAMSSRIIAQKMENNNDVYRRPLLFPTDGFDCSVTV